MIWIKPNWMKQSFKRVKTMKRFSKILGDHARVRALRKREQQKLHFKNKKRVIERESYDPPRTGYSLAMSLANVLYPRNFPKLIATSTKKPSEAHATKTYSELVQLDPKSQRGITNFYNAKKINVPNLKAYARHRARVYKQSTTVSRKIFETTGIDANMLEMNVGRTKRNTVFFELEQINIPKLVMHIRLLPENTLRQRLTKKQALGLITSLEKSPRKGSWLKVHAQGYVS